MSDRQALVQIFAKLFEIAEDDVFQATMANTEKWDSLSHMNLILEIESQILSDKVSVHDLVGLTSFVECEKFMLEAVT